MTSYALNGIVEKVGDQTEVSLVDLALDAYECA